MAETTTPKSKTTKKRLPKSKRTHIRRLKQEAAKTVGGNVTHG
jgi:hypothetical protein